MESDLSRLRGCKNARDFVKTLSEVIDDTLTDDFWKITLPNDLATTSAQSPSLFAYNASLNILGATALFSDIKVSELMDPAVKSTRASIERHHLFPKKYLKTIGIKDRNDINQIANFALIEWPDNSDISALAPKQYSSMYSSKISKDMIYWHALPSGWENMRYNEFLKSRRKAMATVVRDAFKKL
jgi:hypothetical protein